MLTERMPKRSGLVLGVAIFFSLAAGLRAADIVTFADPNLQEAVQHELGLDRSTPVTSDDLSRLVVLDCFGADGVVKSLDGIQGATNLSNLLLDGQSINDLSPLSGLASLETLAVDDNQVQDLSPLQNLHNLSRLSLNGNSIEDLSPLRGLPLTYLYLLENQISDISPLAEMKTLRGLLLSRNPLNAAAYDVYIPKIEANNPGMYIVYDIPEPTTLSFAIGCISLVSLRKSHH